MFPSRVIFKELRTISMDKSGNGGADSLFFALMLPLLLYIVYLIREFQVILKKIMLAKN